MKKIISAIVVMMIVAFTGTALASDNQNTVNKKRIAVICVYDGNKLGVEKFYDAISQELPPIFDAEILSRNEIKALISDIKATDLTSTEKALAFAQKNKIDMVILNFENSFKIRNDVATAKCTAYVIDAQSQKNFNFEYEISWTKKEFTEAKAQGISEQCIPVKKMGEAIKAKI